MLYNIFYFQDNSSGLVNIIEIPAVLFIVLHSLLLLQKPLGQPDSYYLLLFSHSVVSDYLWLNGL